MKFSLKKKPELSYDAPNIYYNQTVILIHGSEIFEDKKWLRAVISIVQRLFISTIS